MLIGAVFPNLRATMPVLSYAEVLVPALIYLHSTF